MKKVVLPVVGAVQQSSPADVRPGKTIIAYLPLYLTNMLDPNEFPWVNVRNQDPEVQATKTTHLVRAALYGNEADPSSFHIKNQGVSILAKAAVIRHNGHVELYMENDVHGLFNGGGTTYAILSGKYRDIVAYVRVEILVGDFSDSAFRLDVNLARNCGTPVDEYSKANSRGWFDWLKAIPGVPRLKYKEGEEGISVGYLYQLLGLLLLESTADRTIGQWMPTKAYTGRNAVLAHYGHNKPDYQKYARLLPELLALHDYIMQRVYLLPGYQTSYFATNPHARRTLRPFFGELPVEHKPPQALIFPLFAAFRAAIAEGSEPAFLVNPKVVFDRVGGKMLDYVVGVLGEQGNNNNKLGRTQEVYDVLYDHVAKGVAALANTKAKAAGK